MGMIADVTIVEGDTYPNLDFTLKTIAGVAHDLTGGTGVFTMARSADDTPKVNRGSMTLIDASNGQIRYSWNAADTTATGLFLGEVEFTFSNGKILTFPQLGNFRIEIRKSLS